MKKQKIIDEKIERLRQEESFLREIHNVIEHELLDGWDHLMIKSTVCWTIKNWIFSANKHEATISKDVYGRIGRFADDLMYQNDRFVLEML